MDDDDSLPPLLNFDGENVAISSGSQRPSIRHRRQSSASNSFSNLRRARTRKFSQSSMDDLLPPRFETNQAAQVSPDNEEEFEQPSTSKKLLVFFAIPVAAGLIFENGASITVDLILIGLACLCLYWSVEIPWQWYFYARTLALEETIHKVNATAVESSDDELTPKSEVHHEPATLDPKAPEKVQDKPEWRTLHSYELNALAACFLAPPVTAYILHHVREYLARPDGSPIENASFVLFVMAAELPPLNQACKLLFAHTMYLQRVVANYDMLEDDKVKELKSLVTRREDGHSKAIDDMSKTIADLQARLASPSPPSGSKTPPSADNRQAVSTQNQVDALNRAVRRYEKRAITQSIVYEARIKDLEAKINDALTLAAAASRSSSHNKSLLSWFSDFFGWLLGAPFRLLHFLFTWPVSAIGDLYRFLLGPRRKKKRVDKGKGSESVFSRRQRIEDR